MINCLSLLIHILINIADNPLATGFDITVGHVDIVVPNVESRSDYVIARAFFYVPFSRYT